MKASELRGRAVISLAEANKVGEVDNVLLDPANNKVTGFRVKHGVFGGAQLLPAANVQSVGPDAIMIADRAALDDRQTAPEVHPLTDLDNLSKIRVVSESGALVGQLGDVEIDAQAMSITEYYLGGSLWDHLTQGSKSFASAPGLRFGGELLIIPDAVAHALTGVAATPAPAPDVPVGPDATAPADAPAPSMPPPLADDKARGGAGAA